MAAQAFDRFFGFGDSTVDSGWYRTTPTGDPQIDALLPAAIANGGGIATTGPGPMNSQLLASRFGLSAIPANQPGGANYATGGAADALVNTSGNINAVPTVTQIANYLAAYGGVADPHGLYLVSSGGNDITAAAALKGPAQTSYVLAASQSLVTGIQQLKGAGAGVIIVPDQPQSFGSADLQSLRGLYNMSLWSGLANAGVAFIPADFDGMLRAVLANPASFGLQPGVAPACINPGLTTAWAILCTPQTLVAPNAAQTHLFADDEHLSSAGQAIEADYYYSLVTAPSEMSLLAEAPLQTREAAIEAIENQIPLSERHAGALGFNAWIAGDLSSIAFDAGAGFSDASATPGLVIGGLDYRIASGLLLGVALSGGAQTSAFSLGGGFTQNDVAGSLYGAIERAPFWGQAVASYGALHDSVNRAVPIGVSVQQNHATTDGLDLSLALRAGYDFTFGGVTHGPFVGLTAQSVTINGFTETGSFTSLGFGSQIRLSDVTALGYQTSLAWGAWSPFARIEWDHELMPTGGAVTATLTTIAAPSYTLPAATFGSNWCSATVGVSLDIARGFVATVSFSGQAGQDRVTAYGGQLGLSASF
jgi:outer membrane lipase/esterase